MTAHHVLTDGFVPASQVPGLRFPAFPHSRRALVLSILAQLAETQWWPEERLREHQLAQLALLVRHAAITTRYGRERFPELATVALDWDRFSRLPVLHRDTVQNSRDTLLSESVPREHGKAAPAKTSGSVGTPVVAERTDVHMVMWDSITAREHLWFGRDTSQPMATIRLVQGADYPDGRTTPAWGEGAFVIGPPGPCHVLGVQTTVEQQFEWLRRRSFAYLLLYPSLLREILRLSVQRDVRFPDLRAVRTFGEVLAPDLREAVREAWGVPIQDVYSTMEQGYIGLQCPEHEHFHVQSESVHVEILRDDDTPCEVGERGRVVVTSLHNFAMPLVRYDVGDFAVRGAPCPCGRGLPVLDRVVGRVHETIVTGTGDRIWLTIGVPFLREIAPIRQHQVYQRVPGELEFRLVPERPPTPGEEESLKAFFATKVPQGMRFTLSWVDEIPRGPSGKFFDIRSEV